MDAISIAVAVTILSVGLTLVYLFKSDYESRQKKINNISSNNNHNDTNRKVNNKKDAKLVSPNPGIILATKQVPLAAVIQHPPPAPQHHTSSATSINNNCISNNKHTQSVKNNSNQLSKETTRSNQQHHTKTKIHSASNGNRKTEILQSIDLLDSQSTNDGVRGTDPSIDELDTSVILGMLANPLNIKLQATNKVVKKTAPSIQNQTNYSFNHPPSLINEKKLPSSRNRKQNSDYSTEQLFNIIAASNLSKDEVELAVETLLNKIESGESDWKQPKGDPLQRLKNQLRESESALSVEIQNHEQTRARLQELKLQLQGEKSSNSQVREELMKLRQEFGVVSLGLEQTRGDLSKQQILNKKLNEESSQVVAKLEQEKAHLQNLLTNNSGKDSELSKVRNQLEEKNGQLKRFELSNQALGEKLHELESKLRNNEAQLEKLRSSKQHDDYEFGAKISELESDRKQLEKALKDHVARLKEASETNHMLEKSIKELQIVSNNQEELLKRSRDERHINETSMKRTLYEMEQELKELQAKLTSNSASNDERLRQKVSQVELELSEADQREQKLMSDFKELRAGLSTLLPNYIDTSKLQVQGEDWVHHYLDALKQLAKTVDELREVNNNNSLPSTPTKKSVDKSTLTIRTNGASSRVNSPTNNGRASKGK